MLLIRVPSPCPCTSKCDIVSVVKVCLHITLLHLCPSKALFGMMSMAPLMDLEQEWIWNKNAFQKDAYRRLVAHISQHALLPGVYLSRWVPAQGECTCPGGCTCLGDVPAGGCTQVLPPVDRILDTRY